MGGGPSDHILALLPLQRDDAVIDRLQKKFPHVKITYKYVEFSNNNHEELSKQIPTGKPRSSTDA